MLARGLYWGGLEVSAWHQHYPRRRHAKAPTGTCWVWSLDMDSGDREGAISGFNGALSVRICQSACILGV